MEIKEIRYTHTRRLIAALSELLGGTGGISELAERLDKSQSQVSQFAGENPVKGIGHKIARQIESALGIQLGAIDSPYIPDYVIRRGDGSLLVVEVKPAAALGDHQPHRGIQPIASGEYEGKPAKAAVRIIRDNLDTLDAADVLLLQDALNILLHQARAESDDKLSDT